MACFSIFIFLTFNCLAYLEAIDLNKSVDEKWQLIPDKNLNLNLVDVNKYVEAEPVFNAILQTIFRLFTRGNPNNDQLITLHNQGELTRSNFNRDHPTRFIIHGWNNDARSDVNINIKNAYLQRGNFNVFIVDWGRGANTINYISARNRVNAVGSVVFSFLQFLVQNGVSLPTVSLIGHSLGAHIAGMASKNLKSNQVGSIIALDPALPLFSMDRPDDRLHSSDANYVESIQTDIGRLGMSQPIGQVAFYPNFGGSHPGCGIDLSGSCAHSRSWQFFSESINSDVGFWATRCNHFVDIIDKQCIPNGPNRRMGGEPLNRSGNGVYYLRTNNRSPFALG